MKPKGSLPCSQDPAASPYLDVAESATEHKQ